jgi:hypothetical protein
MVAWTTQPAGDAISIMQGGWHCSGCASTPSYDFLFSNRPASGSGGVRHRAAHGISDASRGL